MKFNLKKLSSLSLVAISFIKITLFAGGVHVGNGGGFIEIMIFNELNNISSSLLSIEQNTNLNSEIKKEIRELSKKSSNIRFTFLDQKIFLPPTSTNSTAADGVLACNDKTIYVDHQRLVKHSGFLNNWHIIAKWIVFEALICGESYPSINNEQIFLHLKERDVFETIAWGFKDIFKFNLGIIITNLQDSLHKIEIVDDKKSYEFTDNILPLLKCEDENFWKNTTYFLEKTQSFIFLEQLNTTLKFSIQGTCGSLIQKKNFKLQLLFDTGDTIPQKFLEGPTPFSQLMLKKYNLLEE